MSGNNSELKYMLQATIHQNYTQKYRICIQENRSLYLNNQPHRQKHTNKETYNQRETISNKFDFQF